MLVQASAAKNIGTVAANDFSKPSRKGKVKMVSTVDEQPPTCQASTEITSPSGCLISTIPLFVDMSQVQPSYAAGGNRAMMLSTARTSET